MKLLTTAALAAMVLAAPAFAGDAAKGEKVFNKCKACHTLVDAAGTAVIKGGKTGPNLYGVIGRPVASVADFNYSESIKAVGAKAVVWDEAMLVEYVADPKAWLNKQLGATDAKSNMSFKLNKPEDAADLAAYLATLK